MTDPILRWTRMWREAAELSASVASDGGRVRDGMRCECEVAEPNFQAAGCFLYRRATSARRCHATWQAGSGAPPKMILMHEAPFSKERRQRITHVEDRAVDACITYGCLSVLDGSTSLTPCGTLSRAQLRVFYAAGAKSDDPARYPVENARTRGRMKQRSGTQPRAQIIGATVALTGIRYVHRLSDGRASV
jgi:hypothetical protein